MVLAVAVNVGLKVAQMLRKQSELSAGFISIWAAAQALRTIANLCRSIPYVV